VTPLRALVRKELAVLFGSPVAYLALTMVTVVTAVQFFELLRVYNHQLFVASTPTMGGFDVDTIPEHINVVDRVFLPATERLAILLVALIPLVTMRFFAEERARGTDELLLTTLLSPFQITLAKFVAAFAFVALMLLVSLVYPAASLAIAGLGLRHLLAVYTGLLALGIAVASLGLVCSACTRSQLVAAISAYAAAFVLYDFAWATPFLRERPAVAAFLDAVSLLPRFLGFAQGIVQVADLVFFAGLAVVCFALVRATFDLERGR
jgi:ABC-2 type transport system permease protein